MVVIMAIFQVIIYNDFLNIIFSLRNLKKTNPALFLNLFLYLQSPSYLWFNLLIIICYLTVNKNVE